MGNGKAKLQQAKWHRIRQLIWKDAYTLCIVSSISHLRVISISNRCSSGCCRSDLRKGKKAHCMCVSLSGQSQDRQWNIHHWSNCEDGIASEEPEGKIWLFVWSALYENGTEHGNFGTNISSKQIQISIFFSIILFSWYMDNMLSHTAW